MPDVRMPDGTIIRNVPEGTTRSQLSARLNKAKGPDRSGIIGDIDAGLRGFADMATFGLADKIAAAADTVIPVTAGARSGWSDGFGSAFRNNLRVQQGVDRADERQNPVARAAGQIGGGVFGPVPGRGLIMKGAGKLAASGGRAAKAAPVLRIGAEGAVQGGLYGAGSGDSTNIAERLANARDGALQGGGGALVGAGLVRGAARGISPVRSKAVSKLAQSGIIMTPGQRGGPVKRFVEETAESVPGLKQVIGSAKSRGLSQFNRALYDEGLAPIGVKTPSSVKPGRDMAQFAQDAVSNAFEDALDGLDAPVDQVFTQNINTLAARAGQLPGDLGDTFNVVMSQEVGPLLSGKASLDGKTLQRVSQILQKRAAAADGSQSPIGDMLGDAFREARAEFLDLAARSNPDRVGKFLAANDAEANLSRVYDAVSKAGGDGLTTPRAFGAAVRKKGFGTTAKRVARGDARMQALSDAASEVLPNQLPNSGTADRGAMLAGGTALLSGGAGTINPLFALPAAGVTPYLPGVDRALQALSLRGQGPTARGLADQIRQRAYIGGMFGAPAALTVRD